MRRGAPQAIQVADRFHLLKNLTEVLERTLTRQHAALRAAAQAAAAQPATATRGVAAAQEHTDGPERATGQVAAPPVDNPMERTQAAATLAGDTRPPTRVQQEQQARRARRLAQYQEVLAFAAQGWSQQQIASTLGMGRKTVRRLLRAEGFPERLPAPTRARVLDR